jgi:hypothetical protein
LIMSSSRLSISRGSMRRRSTAGKQRAVPPSASAVT